MKSLDEMSLADIVELSELDVQHVTGGDGPGGSSKEHH